MAISEKIKTAGREVLVTTRLKISHAHKDKRLPILLGLELVLVMVLVGSGLVYLNPDVNLPESFSASIEVRVFVFLVILAGVLYLYSLTAGYRDQRYSFWKNEKKKILGK